MCSLLIYTSKMKPYVATKETRKRETSANVDTFEYRLLKQADKSDFETAMKERLKKRVREFFEAHRNGKKSLEDIISSLNGPLDTNKAYAEAMRSQNISRENSIRSFQPVILSEEPKPKKLKLEPKEESEETEELGKGGNILKSAGIVVEQEIPLIKTKPKPKKSGNTEAMSFSLLNENETVDSIQKMCEDRGLSCPSIEIFNMLDSALQETMREFIDQSIHLIDKEPSPQLKSLEDSRPRLERFCTFRRSSSSCEETLSRQHILSVMRNYSWLTELIYAEVLKLDV
jgi:hypothetical protein